MNSQIFFSATIAVYSTYLSLVSAGCLLEAVYLGKQSYIIFFNTSVGKLGQIVQSLLEFGPFSYSV